MSKEVELLGDDQAVTDEVPHRATSAHPCAGPRGGFAHGRRERALKDWNLSPGSCQRTTSLKKLVSAGVRVADTTGSRLASPATCSSTRSRQTRPAPRRPPVESRSPIRSLH